MSGEPGNEDMVAGALGYGGNTENHMLLAASHAN